MLRSRIVIEDPVASLPDGAGAGTKGLGGGGVCKGDCEGGNQYAIDATGIFGLKSRLLVGAAF